MRIDRELAGLLSGFFLDISKAYFIGTFVTPQLTGADSLGQIIWLLTRGIVNVTMFLFLAWWASKLKKDNE